MRELPTYQPDFEEYIRMKEADTDGFPYERHDVSDHYVAMSLEEHIRRHEAYPPQVPLQVPLQVQDRHKNPHK